MAQSVAFIRFQMRMLVSNDGVITLQKTAQGQAICARAIGDEENRAVFLKDFTDRGLGAFGIMIVAVANDMSLVRLNDSSQNLR